MTARILATNEIVTGDLWDTGFFFAEDGRNWYDYEVEILET